MPIKVKILKENKSKKLLNESFVEMISDPNNWAMLAALGVSIPILKSLLSGTSRKKLEDMSPDEFFRYLEAVNKSDEEWRGKSKPNLPFPPDDEATDSVPVSSPEEEKEKELARIKKRLGISNAESNSDYDFDLER